MTDGRTTTLAGATLALTGLFLTVPAAPASADPGIEEIAARVDRLDEAADRLESREQRVSRSLSRDRHALRKTERALDRAHRAQRRQERAVVSALVSGVEHRADALESLGDEAAGAGRAAVGTRVKHVTVARSLARSEDRLAALEQRQDVLQRDILAAAQQRAELRPKAERARRQADTALAVLEREREQRASRAAERAAAAPAAGASAVVSFALAQVGDAYVYGAAGPSAWDCSGLTMMAWRAAGVSLPHNSGAQLGSGTPVPVSALQPGDLVFYYSPVSHVGIYIGNGQIVHAGTPSTGVRVDPLHLMPLTGAVRPG